MESGEGENTSYSISLFVIKILFCYYGNVSKVCQVGINEKFL